MAKCLLRAKCLATPTRRMVQRNWRWKLISVWINAPLLFGASFRKADSCCATSATKWPALHHRRRRNWPADCNHLGTTGGCCEQSFAGEQWRMCGDGVWTCIWTLRACRHPTYIILQIGDTVRIKRFRKIRTWDFVDDLCKRERLPNSLFANFISTRYHKKTELPVDSFRPAGRIAVFKSQWPLTIFRVLCDFMAAWTISTCSRPMYIHDSCERAYKDCQMEFSANIGSAIPTRKHGQNPHVFPYKLLMMSLSSCLRRD